MKPFDLEKALAGAPVQLRNGSKAYVLYDIRNYFNDTTCTKTLFGIRSEHNNSERFYGLVSWLTNGNFYSDGDESHYDIIGMWEEPKLTTKQLMEKAFQDKLLLTHNLLPSYCRGFKVVGKTLDNDYILLDCDNSTLHFLRIFNEHIEWSMRK